MESTNQVSRSTIPRAFSRTWNFSSGALVLCISEPISCSHRFQGQRANELALMGRVAASKVFSETQWRRAIEAIEIGYSALWLGTLSGSTLQTK